MDIWQQGLEKHLIQFIKNPSDLSSTQEMYRIFSRNEKFQQGAAKRLLANENFKALFDSWHFPKEISLQELTQLPENTFGHIYAQHMLKNNLSPNFITEFEEKNLLSYLWMRAKHVHDIGHVLTGFDTTLMGEISLKGFELAQYSSPSTAATTAAGLFSLVCLMPDQVQNIFSTFMKGYDLGQRYPLLMAVKWENEWTTSITDLRLKLGLPASP